MIFYDINLEVDSKVPRANRTSLIKKPTSNNSMRNFWKNFKENSKKDFERDTEDNALSKEQHTTNTNPTSEPDIRHSERDSNSIGNCTLLVNVLESAAESESEKGYFFNCKPKISAIEDDKKDCVKSVLKSRLLVLNWRLKTFA